MAESEESQVEQERTPKRVAKHKRIMFSPEDIETRYQEHLKRIGGKSS